jgi:hypothetical protein
MDEAINRLQSEIATLQNTPKPDPETEIKRTKAFRVGLDIVLQEVKKSPGSRERSLAITKIQEAVMWLGMDLKERGAANPYPNSYKPENAIVDKTADGLKL